MKSTLAFCTMSLFFIVLSLLSSKHEMVIEAILIAAVLALLAIALRP